MASLNLSINGPSIKSSYNGVINGPAPSTDSPTHAQWALFTVQAPLQNAFQDSGAKESILKVQGTGDGELSDLIEDFSEGRVQYAFVKVKDPNSGLPKYILIAWCGGGVPERTKGYFTSHTAAVSKILHGYHVQITARSESDLEPQVVMEKVANASGAKYSAGSSIGAPAPRPPVKSKPVFTPTTYSAGRVDPIVAARTKKDSNVDEDGWGADAPPVSRSQIEKVDSAYKPTKVNMAELTKQKPESSRFSAAPPKPEAPSDVVRGGYQPIGKVDIAAIRAQAKEKKDDRPTPVKGAYEPVGKVDIAAIRARAQKPANEEPEPVEESKPLSERAAAFSQPPVSERLTTLPKPKVANKFVGSSSFTGTKPPTGGGKTPAQLWAEKKAKERGVDVGSVGSPPPTASPVEPQTSGGGWKSGYSGKSWAPVHTSSQFGRPHESIAQQTTGEQDRSVEEETPASSGGVAALKDRFKGTAPISAGSVPQIPRAAEEDHDDAPPPLSQSSRPSGGFALPGLPSRPAPADEQEEEQEDPSAYEPERESSPVRIAVPVSASRPVVEPPEARAPPPIPAADIDVPDEDELPDEQEQTRAARGAATAVAEQEFEPEQVAAAQSSQGGYRAVVQYDYEKAEENEIELIEGQIVTDIDMVDDDWWLGTNSKGERGLFPSNYVEITEEPSEISFPEDAKITNLEFPDEDWWAGEYNGKKGLFPANYVQLDS
uniref:SH3 domain-containing protein n=1 Tax=Bionectria ochroleuca TaxID=29856 RepID=A0A0B7KMC0_BIOOC